MIIYHSKKKLYVILLFLTIVFCILLQSCTLIPIPTIDQNNTIYGNIQVNSEPNGAYIYLNGVFTGFLTPHLLTNVTDGSLITLKLPGYLNSNNIVQISSNQLITLNVILTPIMLPPSLDSSYLTDIEVNPKIFNLTIGEIGQIQSVTAYYSDETSKPIPLNECSFLSINTNIASVSNNGQITGLSEGNTIVWITYTENNITKSDSIIIYVSPGQSPDLGNLLYIIVSPPSISLNIGESKAISSITAYYDSGAVKALSPFLCSFTVNNDIVSVDNSGLITGKNPGMATVTVTYQEGQISKSDTISVLVSDTVIEPREYRALSIGIGDYIYYGPDGDLLAPPYDVNKMTEIYTDCRLGSLNNTFKRIDTLIDQQATKTNILNKIQNTFLGAKENDISYFYFSGHGALLNNISYLCPADFNGSVSTAISVNELESALSAIPGIKVIFIDSCHSGGFIGKNVTENNEEFFNNYLSFFNNSIIDTFASKALSKDLLTSNDYQVLTSCHWYEVSYEIYPDVGEPFGVFTQALYEGCSLSNNTPADLNWDDKISLQEAYQFIVQWVAAMKVNQNVQVYPSNSSFTIFEY